MFFRTDLKKFRSETNEIFHAEMVGIPRSQRILQHQVLAFRMLSTAACCAEFYIYAAWRGFPVQLFAALDGNSNLASARPCLLCPLSQQILQLFGDDLYGDDCQAVIHALASKFSLDISDLESRRASTRRINTVRSVQTRRSQLVVVSADWACRCNVTNREEVLGVTKPVAEQASASEAPDDGQKKKHHRANPWNAFLSQECKSKFNSKPDVGVKSFRDRFKNLSDEEKQHFKDMSRVAVI